MKLSLKLKTILSVVLFCVIFVALILIASFLDLQVSKIMTKGILEPGAYHSTNFFGVLLESVGCLPIYLFIAFALCVLFWCSLRVLKTKNKAINVVLGVICAIGVVAACWYAIKDSAGYVFEHAIARTGYGTLEALDKFEHSATVFAIEAVFAAVMAALAILATMHFKEDVLKKLFKFVIFAAVATLVANLLIMIVKTPVGRPRFRALQSELGQSFKEDGVIAFRPWYKGGGQPDAGVVSAFENTYGVDDAFKSFPSGHTCSAGTLYALIMIPDLFELKHKKGAKLACWLVPILYVGLVAVSRIMVGAHFMSDVTFGGTIAFVCFVIAREVMLKGKHVFAVFPKSAQQPEQVAENVSDEAETEPEEEAQIPQDGVSEAAKPEEAHEDVAVEKEEVPAPTEETQE